MAVYVPCQIIFIYRTSDIGEPSGLSAFSLCLLFVFHTYNRNPLGNPCEPVGCRVCGLRFGRNPKEKGRLCSALFAVVLSVFSTVYNTANCHFRNVVSVCNKFHCMTVCNHFSNVILVSFCQFAFWCCLCWCCHCIDKVRR